MATSRIDYMAEAVEAARSVLTGDAHRTQKIQDVRARKARGADLAFEMAREVVVSGTLPGGGKDSAIVRVAAIVPSTVWTIRKSEPSGSETLTSG